MHFMTYQRNDLFPAAAAEDAGDNTTLTCLQRLLKLPLLATSWLSRPWRRHGSYSAVPLRDLNTIKKAKRD
jgi:hypothetical protein